MQIRYGEDERELGTISTGYMFRARTPDRTLVYRGRSHKEACEALDFAEKERVARKS